VTAFFRRFILALQFLTVVPIWPGIKPRERDLPGSMMFYPLVGLLLGLALVGARWLFRFWPPVVTDALTVALMVVFTRGLHLEGLADTADGLGHGLNRDRALAVMKDSRSGAFAVMAVALILLVKWASLLGMPPHWKTPALILMAVSGRLAMVAAAFRNTYARPAGPDGVQGLARPFVEDLRFRETGPALVIALIIGVILTGSPGGLTVLAAAGFGLLAGYYFKKRLGGVTGDTIGATGELAEAGVLLALAAKGF
jgi:adenosylcobinamide-GDP ribazoletransferase